MRHQFVRSPRNTPRRTLIALTLTIFITGCALRQSGRPAPTVLPTLTAIPSAPVAATEAVLTLTHTTTPAASPTPTHPLMIEVMRAADYPGSEITLVRELDDGPNYHRAIVSYQSEGNRINAYLTTPLGDPPATGWPVTVFNHGYIQPEVYRNTVDYASYTHAFARSGYMVFMSDYRGHGESEGIAPGGYSNPSYSIDVLNGISSIKTYPDADPNRIGMWGHSMGGQITLRVMVVSPDVRAGVIWGGVVASYTDLYYRWNGPRSGLQSTITPIPSPTPWRYAWSQDIEATFGLPDENPAFWASISPNSYLDDLSGPIQLHHGGADTVVPPLLSELLYRDLLAASLPAEIHIYDGDDHNISQNFELAMVYSISFFDQHVKNAPSP